MYYTKHKVDRLLNAARAIFDPPGILKREGLSTLPYIMQDPLHGTVILFQHPSPFSKPISTLPLGAPLSGLYRKRRFINL